MFFYTMFNRPERKPESFNNTKQKIYKASYDVKGVRKLVVDKEVDIYEKIQEYANDTNLTNLFNKYGLSVYDQLKKSEEQLIDLTNLPTNLMEAMKVIDDAKYCFNRQSKDFKQRFNNDFNQFIASSETGQLAQLLNEELKVSAEKFNTANMANFEAHNKVNLVSYPEQRPVVTENSTTQVQPVIQPTQTTQQGVNLNV